MDFSYATCHLSLSLLLAVSTRFLHSSSQTETFPPGASIKTGPCLICCAIKWDMLPFMHEIQKWVGWANTTLLLVSREMLLPSGRIDTVPACLDLVPCVSNTSVEYPYSTELKGFPYAHLICDEELPNELDISLEYPEDS